MSDVNTEKSIFSIEADLEAIFMELEDNGGELTPELEDKLKITQENFENKVSKYVKAIRYYEDNVTILKGRKKNIEDLLKVRENRAKRLRSLKVNLVIVFLNFGMQSYLQKILKLLNSKKIVLLFLLLSFSSMLVNFITKVFLKQVKILILLEC